MRRKTVSSTSNGNGNDEGDQSEEQVFRLAARVGAFSKEGKGHSTEDRYFICDDLMSIQSKSKDETHGSENNAASSTSINETMPSALVAVYDGHGGPECAEFLANNLHLCLAENVRNNPSNVTKAIQSTFEAMENQFLSHAREKGIVSGSCAAIALINELEVTVAHCGDCRVVVQGDRGPIELTKDHRLARMAEKSRVLEAGGKIVGNRVMGMLIPTRSFGNVDVKTSSPGVVIAEPDILKYRLELGKDSHAYLIVASDGVWDVLENDKAMDIVVKQFKKTRDPQKAASALVIEAAKYGTDDVTAAVVVWSIVAENRSTTVSAIARSPSNGEVLNQQSASGDKILDHLVEEEVEETNDRDEKSSND